MTVSETRSTLKGTMSLTRIYGIELYILHLKPLQPDPYHVYGDHYHVLMHMKTNIGASWTEVFMNEANRPADWVCWASWYEKYLRRSFRSEEELLADMLVSMNPVHLQKAQLLYDALHLLKGDKKFEASIGLPENDIIKLVSEAEAYVSLF